MNLVLDLSINKKHDIGGKTFEKFMKIKEAEDKMNKDLVQEPDPLRKEPALFAPELFK